MLSTIFSLLGIFKNIIKRLIQKTPTSILLLISMIIAGYFFYYLGASVGESNIRTQLKYEEYKQKYAAQEVKTKTTDAVNQLSQALSTQYLQINETKEKDHDQTRTTAHDLKLKYAADSVHQSISPTTTGDRRTSSLSAPTKTIVVSLPSDWAFSPKDRQFLIDEAARADRVDQELKACKATVDEIYKNHEKYQEEMKRYGERLHQVNTQK